MLKWYVKLANGVCWIEKLILFLNESEKVKIERKMPNYNVSADNFGHKIECHDAGALNNLTKFHFSMFRLFQVFRNRKLTF